MSKKVRPLRIIGLAPIFSNCIPGRTLRTRHVDPREQFDDIPTFGNRRGSLDIRGAVSCELGGLIRRARYELSHGQTERAFVTLGRADDLANSLATM